MPLRRRIAFLLLACAAAPAVAGARCPAGDPEQLAMTAELALTRADWPAATARYACAAARSGDAGVAERGARLALDHGQLPQAVATARRWLELDPGNEVALRHLAVALLRSYEAEQAAGHFGRLLDTVYEDRARGYGVLLGILAAERNETGAAQVMERLASRDAGLAEAQHARSVLWQRAQHGANALAAARRALELRPGWRPAALAEVRALQTLGQADQALERLSGLATDGDAFARISQAWLLAAAERRDEAQRVFGELRRDNATRGEALEGLGALALDEGRLDDAEALFSELARETRGADTVHWFLGRVAEERGNDTLAIRHYQRVTGGSRAVAAQLRAARLYASVGLGPRGELQLDDFLSVSPDSTRDLVAGRATQLADAGRGDEAIALLDRALGLLPDDDLRMARGFLLDRLGRLDEAIEEMRGVLASRPADPDTLNALGYTLVDRTGSVEEGYRLIARAIAGKPDSYAIADSMGWALVRLGRVEEGLPWLQRSWDRSRDPEVAAHLGEALWQLGQPDEARAIWERASAEHPDSEPLRRAIGRRLP